MTDIEKEKLIKELEGLIMLLDSISSKLGSEDVVLIEKKFITKITEMNVVCVGYYEKKPVKFKFCIDSIFLLRNMEPVITIKFQTIDSYNIQGENNNQDLSVINLSLSNGEVIKLEFEKQFCNVMKRFLKFFVNLVPEKVKNENQVNKISKNIPKKVVELNRQNRRYSIDDNSTQKLLNLIESGLWEEEGKKETLINKGGKTFAGATTPDTDVSIEEIYSLVGANEVNKNENFPKRSSSPFSGEEIIDLINKGLAKENRKKKKKEVSGEEILSLIESKIEKKEEESDDEIKKEKKEKHVYNCSKINDILEIKEQKIEELEKLNTSLVEKLLDWKEKTKDMFTEKLVNEKGFVDLEKENKLLLKEKKKFEFEIEALRKEFNSYKIETDTKTKILKREKEKKEKEFEEEKKKWEEIQKENETKFAKYKNEMEKINKQIVNEKDQEITSLENRIKNEEEKKRDLFEENEILQKKFNEMKNNELNKEKTKTKEKINEKYPYFENVNNKTENDEIILGDNVVQKKIINLKNKSFDSLKKDEFEEEYVSDEEKKSTTKPSENEEFQKIDRTDFEDLDDELSEEEEEYESEEEYFSDDEKE